MRCQWTSFQTLSLGRDSSKIHAVTALGALALSFLQTEPFSCHSSRQYLPAVAGDGLRYPRAGLGFAEKNHAAASAGAADFGCQRSIATSHTDQFLDHRRGDARGIGLAQLPLFTQQSHDFTPVGPRQRLVHAPGNLADAMEVAKHLAIAVDVRLKNPPVVDSRLARRARVSQHETLVQLFSLNLNGLVMNPVGGKMNCAH